MIIIFTAYKILMLKELFKFFEFEDLRCEFCGGFVAIGRRRWQTLVPKLADNTQSLDLKPVAQTLEHCLCQKLTRPVGTNLVASRYIIP